MVILKFKTILGCTLLLFSQSGIADASIKAGDFFERFKKAYENSSVEVLSEMLDSDFLFKFGVYYELGVSEYSVKNKNDFLSLEKTNKSKRFVFQKSVPVQYFYDRLGGFCARVGMNEPSNNDDNLRVIEQWQLCADRAPKSGGEYRITEFRIDSVFIYPSKD